MKFEDTKLLKHPKVREAFNALVQYSALLDKPGQRANGDGWYTSRSPKGDDVLKEGLEVGEILSQSLKNKDPQSVAASLVFPCFIEMVGLAMTMEKFKVLSTVNQKTVDTITELLSEDKHKVKAPSTAQIMYAVEIVDLKSDVHAIAELNTKTDAELLDDINKKTADLGLPAMDEGLLNKFMEVVRGKPVTPMAQPAITSKPKKKSGPKA